MAQATPRRRRVRSAGSTAARLDGDAAAPGRGALIAKNAYGDVAGPTASAENGNPTAEGSWASTESELANAERGLRGLVGGGSSQVKPVMALRARDAARPRPADLARARSDLTIVRRNWVPPTADT